MGIVFRQSIRSTVIVLIGALLGALNVVLMTKYIGKQPLGFSNNVARQAQVFSMVFILGINELISAFIHKYDINDKRRNPLITLATIVPLTITLLSFIPYFLFREHILNLFQPTDRPLMDKYYVLLPLFTLIFVVVITLEQFLATVMKLATVAFMKDFVVRVINFICILLFAFGYISFSFFVISTIGAYLVPIIVYSILLIKDPKFGVSFKFKAFTRNEYKELIHFSWYHFLWQLCRLFLSYLDALALPLFDPNGLKVVAIYNIAVFIISFVQLPSRAMTAPTVVVLSQAMANNEQEKVKDVFKRSSVNILIATVFMGVVIGANISNAIYMLPQGYEPIGILFIILLIGKLVDLATGQNDTILSITNHYKFSVYVSVIMIVIQFGLVKWLVPIYSMYGAAWTTTISLIIYNLFKFLFVWKKLDMQPFSFSSLLILVSGTVAFIASYFFPHFLIDKGHMDLYSIIIDAVIRSVIITVVYLAMLIWLKPSADLQQFLSKLPIIKKVI